MWGHHRHARGGGGGGTLIFSYVRRLRSFFFFFFGGGVQNFEFRYFWGFSKIHIFLSMKILWIFFGGSSQNWTIFRGHFYAFYGLFLRSRYRIGDFWGS